MSDDESRAIFREEALDLLSELDATLLELEDNPGDLDLVNRVFRALHTIKGSGAMFGFDDIANFTHGLENVFDKVRNGDLAVCTSLISVSFAARDHILALLNGEDENGNGSPERGEEIQAQVRQLMAEKCQAEEAALSDPSPVEPDSAEEQEPTPVLPVTYRIRIRPRDPKVDKELTLEDEDELRDHLAGCPPCLAEYSIDVVLKRLVRRSCQEEAPAQLRVRIQRTLLRVRADGVPLT